MGEVLVLVEQSDGSVKKVTSELLTLARRLGEPSAVWVGPGISDDAVATLGEFGATTVYVAGDEALAKHPVAPKAEVLAQLVAEKAPTAVLIASTADGITWEQHPVGLSTVQTIAALGGRAWAGAAGYGSSRFITTTTQSAASIGTGGKTIPGFTGRRPAVL